METADDGRRREVIWEMSVYCSSLFSKPPNELGQEVNDQ
jgi:hypothetical protein